MQPHPLTKMFWAKLVRFGQIWSDLGEIGQNYDEIWTKLR